MKDYREQAKSLVAVEGLWTFQQSLTATAGSPEQVQVGAVTPGLFAMLGEHPAVGRFFRAEDAAPLAAPVGPSAPPPPGTVVLSDGFWRRRFGADPSVIGTTVQLAGLPVTVIGILRPGFRVLMPAAAGVAQDVDVWVTPRIDYATAPRGNVFMRVLARLRPGATLRQAQRELDAIAAAEREGYARYASAGLHLKVVPMQGDITAPVRSAVLALLGAVGFVLLIACANVSNLLLVRATAREGEMALRAALGASRGRLFRQSLVESAVLAVTGAIAGIGIAEIGIRLMLALQPGDLPRIDGVRIDGYVLAFAAAAAILAALLFGVIPALRAARVDLARSLRDRGRSADARRSGFVRNGIVVFEVALSLVLLVGAGLMVRSFLALRNVDPGFRPDHVLTFSVNLPANRYRTPVERSTFWTQLQERLSGLPGVTSVSGGWPLPLTGRVANVPYGNEAILTDPERTRQADVRAVLPGFFKTVGTRLLEGRAFTRADESDSSTVVVVDAALARKTWPGESAVGKRLLVRLFTPEPIWVDVIGVVEHQRNASLAAEGPETIFMTDRYVGGLRQMTWTLRTPGDPLALVPAARASVRDLDPLLPLAQIQPMENLVHRAMAPTRFSLVLIAVFGAAALILASIGLYGVLAYVVRQRTAEIGVRMAFGAQPGRILGMVIRQGLSLALGGMLLGLLAALMLTRLMRSLLVGVRATDLITFLAVALLFTVIAILAAWLPARRALRIDPMAALRDV